MTPRGLPLMIIGSPTHPPPPHRAHAAAPHPADPPAHDPPFPPSFDAAFDPEVGDLLIGDLLRDLDGCDELPRFDVGLCLGRFGPGFCLGARPLFRRRWRWR